MAAHVGSIRSWPRCPPLATTSRHGAHVFPVPGEAFAALAAETTASVGDALGPQEDGKQEDETVGTSAAVGATIGVVAPRQLKN